MNFRDGMDTETRQTFCSCRELNPDSLDAQSIRVNGTQNGLSVNNPANDVM